MEIMHGLSDMDLHSSKPVWLQSLVNAPNCQQRRPKASPCCAWELGQNTVGGKLHDLMERTRN